MRKNPNAFARLVGLLLVSCLLLTLTALASGGAGTSSDPLVTLSYLNEKFLPQVLSKVDQKAAAREKELSGRLAEQIRTDVAEFERKYGASAGTPAGGTAETFAVVTLDKGRTLICDTGCEVMLRIGSASCVASSNPGLVDETAGTTIANGGALQKNHLCMATIAGSGVKAGADGTKLLVRGGYTLGH